MIPKIALSEFYQRAQPVLKDLRDKLDQVEAAANQAWRFIGQLDDAVMDADDQGARQLVEQAIQQLQSMPGMGFAVEALQGILGGGEMAKSAEVSPEFMEEGVKAQQREQDLIKERDELQKKLQEMSNKTDSAGIQDALHRVLVRAKTENPEAYQWIENEWNREMGLSPEPEPTPADWKGEPAAPVAPQVQAKRASLNPVTMQEEYSKELLISEASMLMQKMMNEWPELVVDDISNCGTKAFEYKDGKIHTGEVKWMLTVGSSQMGIGKGVEITMQIKNGFLVQPKEARTPLGEMVPLEPTKFSNWVRLGIK